MKICKFIIIIILLLLLTVSGLIVFFLINYGSKFSTAKTLLPMEKERYENVPRIVMPLIDKETGKYGSTENFLDVVEKKIGLNISPAKKDSETEALAKKMDDLSMSENVEDLNKLVNMARDFVIKYPDKANHPVFAMVLLESDETQNWIYGLRATFNVLTKDDLSRADGLWAYHHLGNLFYRLYLLTEKKEYMKYTYRIYNYIIKYPDYYNYAEVNFHLASICLDDGKPEMAERYFNNTATYSDDMRYKKDLGLVRLYLIQQKYIRAFFSALRVMLNSHKIDNG